MQENFIIYNEEYILINDVLRKLKINTSAKVVFITDAEGHCIASVSYTHLTLPTNREV